MNDRDQNGEITREKKLLREQHLTLRKALNHGKRQAKVLALLENLQDLVELASADHVFSYISSGFEPDTHGVIDWLLQRNKRVSVPRITGDRLIIAVDFPGWDKLETGPMGLPQPISTKEIANIPEICIAPGVCFSENGSRLGYGGGHYDRWLAQNRVALKIGIAYELNIASSLPLEPHDVTMDIIVTEKRLIRIG